MREEFPQRIVQVAPILLGGAALAALLLPYAMQAWSPPGAPGTSFAEMRARVHVGRVLASLFACSAVATLALRFHLDPDGASRQAIFLGLAGVVVSAAALLPIYDGLEAEAVQYRYTAVSALEPSYGAEVEGVRGGLDGLVYKGYALAPATAEEPLTLGPIPITRGDTWVVLAYALGSDASPPLIEAGGVRCAPDALMDGRLSRRGYVGASFHCTAETTGTTLLLAHDGSGDARNHEVTVYALPVLHNAYLQRLDDAVAFHAAGLGLSAFTLLYWVRRMRPYVSLSW